MPPLESQPTAALASLPLMVSQVASAVEVKPGQEITWTLTMRNPGDVTVEGIVLSDIPSSGLIYLGSSVSQGQIQTVGEPPIMVVNVGDIPPQGQIEILLRTAIPVEAEPKQEFTNFASYNSRDLSVGTFNEVKVVVSETVERVDLTLVMDAIDPRMFWGKVIWGTIFVGFIGLVGYIRSRHRGRARQTD